MSIDTAISAINSTIEDLRQLVNTKLSKSITINGKSIAGGSIALNKKDIGLGKCDNTSDLNKPLSLLAQEMFNTKVDKTIKINGFELTSDITLPDPLMGRLDQVDNTSDMNKPISLATQQSLNSKVDKTITINGYELVSNVNLEKMDIGLSQVDNTSDSDKPISNAAQVVLDTISATVDSIVGSLNVLSLSLQNYVQQTRTINGHGLSADVILDKNDIGLDQVDNSSDMDKPVSSQQQAALDLKVDDYSFISSINFYLRDEITTSVKLNFADLPYPNIGSDTVGAEYFMWGIRYKFVYTTDGGWYPTLYLPNVSDYQVYSHFYIWCNSGYSTTIHQARSDQTSYVPLNLGEVAIFVSTGILWAYLGKLYRYI